MVWKSTAQAKWVLSAKLLAKPNWPLLVGSGLINTKNLFWETNTNKLKKWLIKVNITPLW